MQMQEKHNGFAVKGYAKFKKKLTRQLIETCGVELFIVSTSLFTRL